MKYLKITLLHTLSFYLLTFFALVSVSLIAKERDNTLRIAKGFIGVQEEKRNSGYWVDKFLKSVGLKPGSEWCGAFVGYCLDSAKVKSLKVRSGLARRYVQKNSIKATKVLEGNLSIPSGSLLIWRRGTTIFGHVGIVENWKGKNGTTIEGNTSSSNKIKLQYAGQGVYRKQRTINPYNYFRITDFTIYGERTR
jgi:hypothetical protein